MIVFFSFIMDSEDDLDGTLQSFMFGNIDESGRLEDDIFDEESKQHLSCLSNFGLGLLVKELVSSQDVDDLTSESEFSEKAETAIDYSDINEAVLDTEAGVEDDLNVKKGMTEEEEEEEEEDEEEEKEVEKKVSGTSQTVLGISSSGGDVTDRKLKNEQDIVTHDRERSNKFEAPTTDGDISSTNAGQKLNTPLAALLPPELADYDVREWFPEFRRGKVLRFSRLFKPPYMPAIWKHKKKKKLQSDGNDESRTKAADLLVITGASKHEGTSGLQKDSMILDGARTSAEKEQDQEEEDEKDEWWPMKLNMGRSPRPDELMPDDNDLLSHPEMISSESGPDSGLANGNQLQVAEWRFGPSKLWYDMLGVSETGEGFDYGFKLKGEASAEVEEDGEGERLNLPPMPKIEFPYESYIMVNQVHWEDDIIWDGNDKDVRERVMQSMKQKMPYCGWLPSMNCRTLEQFLKQNNPTLHATLSDAGYFTLGGGMLQSKVVGSKTGTGQAHEEGRKMTDKPKFYSIFPVENESLLYGRWEENVIWDAQAMDKIPVPPVLQLDPYDENMILEVPEDHDPLLTSEQQQEQDLKKEKEVKKSKMLLGKAGIIKDEDEEQDKEMTIQNKDPFNLSNDEFYNPKLSVDQMLGRNLGMSLIQHSTPAVELRPPFFPTHLTMAKLRCFHRQPLKKYQHGQVMSGAGPHPVLPLLKQIKRKEHIREQERQASGGGEMFFMRTPEDLTGKDGDLILAEFSEQYPPLMNQTGMATKIKNYYRRKPGKDTDQVEFRYGEPAYSHTSRFLGSLAPGQCLQAFENNMYRAPIYEHRMSETDFLIIRNRSHLYVREVETIFVVGQECPLIEVPGPNSKRANNFIRDFLQVFIYRLFWKSKDNPRRIKMEEIRKAFPIHSENTIRKRLKLCADFKRTGVDSNWWVLNSNFRLPTEEEMREMVTPEQCCAYYSMLAAEQRLKDAGYGEKSLFAQDDENDEETQTKMEDEVKAAPWNTTRAFIAAMKGRCLLDLNGLADPTGCREGFSYVSVPNKPQQVRDEATTHTPVKRTVTGTDADLRRLPLKEAKQLLRKFGLPEAEIKKLSRWEVIDVVRTMSTEQSKALQEGFGTSSSSISKFARGNRFSVAEHRERYKEECQQIFDLQNRILGSDEVLSTDEDSSSDVSEFDEMEKHLQTILLNKKTSAHALHLREEAGRRELNKMLRENLAKEKTTKKKQEDEKDSEAMKGVRTLRITRTFRNENGGEFTRTEIVRNPQVIDKYIWIRETKNPQIIKQFATNEQQKEEMKKEKRRLQEQLRRMKRQQQQMKGDGMSPPAKKRKKETNPLNLHKLQKIKCRACGQVGHMKTNRDCPMFYKLKSGGLAGKVALSAEQEEQLEKSDLVDKDLIISEGTKIKVSRHLVEHTEQVKRKSLVLKLPKIISESKKKRRIGKDLQQCDYLKKSNKLANRRRTDPVVTLSTIFENILKEMKELPNVKLFHFPVNAKQVPDYYNIIKKPMDLQTIRNNIRSRKYLSRETFIVDVNLIVKNSELYNGPKSALTAAAQKMFDFCLQRLTEKEEKIMSLEKAINPMLDVDLVSFGYILSGIVEDRMKTVEGSIPFHQPVNKKQCKDYYDLIERPMDLSTLYKNAKENRYHSREKFLSDIRLMVNNCEKYNGPGSTLSKTAHRLMEVCKQAMMEQEETLQQLEENIRAIQEAALEGLETDSIITATSVTGGDGESVITQKEGFEKSSSQPDAAFPFSSASQGFDREQFEADEAEQMSHDDDSADGIERISSRLEEFIDVEGADEEDGKDERLFVDSEKFAEDSLERDLHMTPERSDDADSDRDDVEEEEDDAVSTAVATNAEEKFDQQSITGNSLNLSSSDSEKEEEDMEEGQSSQLYPVVDGDISEYAEQMEESNAIYRFDEDAQDYVGYEAAIYSSNMGDEEENSFDPQAFFSELAQQDREGTGEIEVGTVIANGKALANADINNDLEVSESDDSDGEFVPVEDDESDQDFNMGDFLSME